MVQIVLLTALMAGLNYLGGRYYWRDHLAAARHSSLSPETLACLRALPRPATIYVTLTENSTDPDARLLYRYSRQLLDQFAYLSRIDNSPSIAVEYIDVFRDLAKTEELRRRYGFDQPYLVLFVSGEQRKAVVPQEIMTFENKEPTAFLGEQAFLRALLEVTSDRRPTVYFLVGHGEMRPDDADPVRGLSEFASQMEARNYRALTLDLLQTPAVPSDAGLVIAAAPQGPLRPEEEEKLRRYLSDQEGRVWLLLQPSVKTGLDDLLFEWGVRVDDSLILEMGEDFLQSSGHMILRQFGRHPLTDILIKNQTPVLTGLCRQVEMEEGAPPDERLSIARLLASSPQSWAERNYQAGATPVMDPAHDSPGPVTVAVAAERSVPSQLGIHLDGGKLLVFGTSDLMSNRLISTPGNFTLAFSVLNWAFQNDAMLSIPPRPIEKYRLQLGADELNRLALLFVAPALVSILLGLAVWWARRF